MEPLDASNLPVETVRLAHRVIDVVEPIVDPVHAMFEAVGDFIRAKSDVAAMRIRAEGEAEATFSRWFVEQSLRQQCQDAVIAQAIEEVGNEQVDADSPNPEPDIVRQLLDGAGYVSAEDLQKLWARALAGEVKRPGSVSRRSIGVLRDLDQETASIFSKLCSACVYTVLPGVGIRDARMPSLGKSAAKNSLSRFGLSFDVLNHLNEHGLVIADYDSYRDLGQQSTIPDDSAERAIPFFYQGKAWLLARQEREIAPSLELRGVALTRAGMEISTVVDLLETPEYTRALDSFFLEKHFRMIEVSDLPEAWHGYAPQINAKPPSPRGT